MIVSIQLNGKQNSTKANRENSEGVKNKFHQVIPALYEDDVIEICCHRDKGNIVFCVLVISNTLTFLWDLTDLESASSWGSDTGTFSRD